MKRVISIPLIILFFCTAIACNEGLPPLDLGLANILGGGSLRPSPGLYWFHYVQYYQSNDVRDFRGKRIEEFGSFKALYVIPSLVYQTSYLFLGGEPGFTFYTAFAAYQKTKGNTDRQYESCPPGIGDTTFGPYIQWRPILYKGEPLFIHRFEFDINIPTGRNKLPETYFNVGAGYFYLTPYWTATFYFNRHLALSWRIYYIWCGESHRTNIKAGDAINFNFSIDWEVKKNWWLSLCGYYVKQFKNNRLCGEYIPDTKEQVLGLGPGVLYFVSDTFQLLGYLYWETLAENRTQGFNGAFRFIWHFDVHPLHES